MRIDYEDVWQMLEERSAFNRPEFRDIEFYKDGKRVEIPEAVIDKWEFMGLNNVDFVSSDFFAWPD